MTVKIINADVLEGLRTMEDESIQCAVTSPPYFSLRDYGTGTWEGGDPDCNHQIIPLFSSKSTIKAPNHKAKDQGIPYKSKCGKCGALRKDKQIGLEETPQDYIDKMVEVFREVRRVLRHDGTCWLNLGDSYCSSTFLGNNNDSTGKLGNSKEWKDALHTKGVSRPIPMGLKPKDMMTIPHRVAQALQAPYYTGRIKSEADRAWLAAMIDGEGCITILECKSGHNSGSSYPPVLQIRMCDRECIDKAMYITGTGGESPRQDPPSTGGNRPSYQWRIHARTAADVIAEIYPYLLIKRKQAIVAWNQQMIRDSYETKKGVKIPVDALEKQKQCRNIIQKLNQKEEVDLPSWMKEPPSLYEPGWYLRQDVVWAKPNPMPESVTDRCTKAHEYIFLLTKSAQYYYDAEAIKDADANKRDVWTITVKAFKEAHFATFPPELPRLCILAGTSEKGACPKCGSPWERIQSRIGPDGTEVVTKASTHSAKKPDGTALMGNNNQHSDTPLLRTSAGGIAKKGIVQKETVGWAPTCDCGEEETVPCKVFDPFGGSGTTAMVANRLGRDAVFTELNPEYCKLAESRIHSSDPLYVETSIERPADLSEFMG